MAREISITFALNAALKGGFTAAFQSAAASARGVASAVREMERSATGKLGASIAGQREKIKGLSGSLKDARATLATLQNQAQAAGGGTRMLARQIALAETRVSNLSGALNRQLAAWRETAAEAATAGGSVRRLTEEYANLQARMERAKRLSGSLHANQAQADNLRSQRADLQGRLLSTAATTASVALPVKLAISAEDTFADLRKVMDAPEEVMQQVFADAQAMSNRTGKSFEDVITIMTSAAQAGLGKTREELLGVADQAVKMSIAWGASVEQAGKSMATWRSSMKMTDEQARHTADVINALSNSMNAEAGAIDQIFTRMGPMMKDSGMAAQDIAALATAFKAAGAQVEVSGTAMKNFSNVMKAGSAGLTKEKLAIYKFLEIDPDELQEQFYNDSKGAIMRVLEALKKVRPEERGSVAGSLFGQESIPAISPLLGNLDLLREAFKIANSEVTGSVDDEYANRMKTTATSISQMNQSLRNLGITAGKALLPAVGAVARGITGVVGTIGNLVERFPGLSSAVMITGAAIAAFAVGSLALGLVLNTVRTSVNSVRGVMLRLAASQVTATASTGGLSGASGLFSGIATMAGKSARSFAGGARSIAYSSALAAARTGIMSVATGAFAAASRIAGAGARFFAGGLRSILLATGAGALLVGLGFAINLLIDNWDSVVDAMSGAWAWATDTWGRLGVFFTELGKNLSVIFSGLWEDICGLAASAKDSVAGVWEGITGFFGGLWSGISSGASWFAQTVISFFAGAYDGVAAIWSGAVSVFSAIGQGIAGVFSWAAGSVVGVWLGVSDFFAGIGAFLSQTFSGCWQFVLGIATWAWNGIAGIWNGAVEFFSGIVAGISGVFTGLFSWLREKFAWVFSTINAVSGFAGKITGAVSNAWNKAFGDTEAEKGSAEIPATSTAAATPGEKPLAPNALSATETPAAQTMPGTGEKPVAPLAKPERENGKSFSEFKAQQEAAKKQGKKSSGGRARKGGAGSASESGPITVVTLAGDNNAPQTVFIPAQTRHEKPVMTTASGQAEPSSKQPPVFSEPLKMPAVQAARKSVEVPRVLPLTPALISRKAGTEPNGGQPASIQVELSQQFDLITQDAAAVRKVMESLKPDFEALVRRALDKVNSDRRRTAYAQ